MEFLQKNPLLNGNFSSSAAGRIGFGNRLSGDIRHDGEADGEPDAAGDPDGDNNRDGAASRDAEAVHRGFPRSTNCYTSTSRCNRPRRRHCNTGIHTLPGPAPPPPARVPERVPQPPARVPGRVPQPPARVPPRRGPDSRYPSPDAHRLNLPRDDGDDDPAVRRSVMPSP